MTPDSPAWLRYGVALLATAAIALLRFTIGWEPGHFAYVIFIIPVLFSALYCGSGPALVAMALGMAVANYYFLELPHEFHMNRPLDKERASVCLFVCCMGIFIIARLHAARRRAEDNERALIKQMAERAEVEQSLRLEAAERARIERQLKEALAHAESASRAKSSFLANMSHEIRTPMNAVVGISGILSMSHTLPAQRQQELIRTLQLSAQSMMTVIDDLLDITKIENDNVELEKKSFDLRQLVQEVMEIMSVRANEKNITLTLECDVREGLFSGASSRIRQVLINLIGNAVKFTEKGGVVLRVARGGTEGTREGDICFDVVDTGIGIEQTNFDTIFQKFSQADSSIRRKFGGTGLGLAITRRLVELMGGHITVSSQMGAGSRFRVVLPMGDMADGTAPSDARRGEAPAVLPAGQPRPLVLLVEDYQPNILIATIILEELGCDYEVAGNGNEALACVERQNFNLILMDIQMPGMDGYEAVRRIREREKLRGIPRTPIIGVSAHAFNEDRNRSLSAGMDDYISKPFNLSDLKSRILSLLYHERRKAAG